MESDKNETKSNFPGQAMQTKATANGIPASINKTMRRKEGLGMSIEQISTTNREIMMNEYNMKGMKEAILNDPFLNREGNAQNRLKRKHW